MDIQDELRKAWDERVPAEDEAASEAFAEKDADRESDRRHYALGYIEGRRAGLAADRFDPADDYDPRWELLSLAKELAVAKYGTEAPNPASRQGWAIVIVADAAALLAEVDNLTKGGKK